MRPNAFSTLSHLISQVTRFTAAVVCAGLLASCGGGATSDGGTIPYTGTGFNTRALPQEFIARQAVNYSPYRSGDRSAELVGLLAPGNYVAMQANVLQDLNLLQSGNIRLIRLFATDAPKDPATGDVSENLGLAKLILDVIKDNNLDIKVQLGIWITGITSSDPHLSPAQNQAVIEAAKQANADEIARGVKLANDYCPTKNVNDASCIVLTVSVGNEQMVNWSTGMDPNVMAAYLTTVRSQVPQPVTTDDDWAFWASANGNTASPTPVLNTIDFVSMHTYPMSETPFNQWDWKQAGITDVTKRAQAMMNAAITRAQADYNAVRSNLDRHGRIDLPISIGETGWRAANTFNPDMTFRASPVNQKMYFSGLNSWAHAAKISGGPANIFYFEAFDEPWKGGDDKWGLFNVSREARCPVKDLSATFTAEASSCDASAAVYWLPAVVNTITASKYTLYADTVTLGESKPILWWELMPNAWSGSGPTVSMAAVTTTSAPGDGSESQALTPSPASWGWGMAFMLTPRSPENIEAADLSQLGYLNFSIKTLYPGKIEVGFVTGRGSDSSSYEVFMQLESGQYGYANDGAWHEVKIPVSAIKAMAVARSGEPDSHGNSVDLTVVSQPFVIADRYGYTGNVPGATNTLNIDHIFWSAN